MTQHRWRAGIGMCLNDMWCDKCGQWAERGDDKPDGCPAPEFTRMHKYTVLKWSDVDKLPKKQQKRIDALLDKLSGIMDDAGMPMRNCVVVEEDDPNYDKVWRMIEWRFHADWRAQQGG